MTDRWDTLYQDSNEVAEWADKMYNELFSKYFNLIEEVHLELQDKLVQISDTSLSHILLDLPIELINVSEDLATFKLRCESIKLDIKQREQSLVESSELLTKTAKEEAAAKAVAEDKLMLKATAIIIERVEREISFARELIMSAKKIWDARRRTENVNPVNVHGIDNLPEANLSPQTNAKANQFKYIY